METIDLPSIVVDTESIKARVISVDIIREGTDAKLTIPYSDFINRYTEYIDPKDVEIKRLQAEVKKLKEKCKPNRQPRRFLLKGEKDEIRELIRKGENNTKLGMEYKVSESTISKMRVEMRKAGEDV